MPLKNPAGRVLGTSPSNKFERLSFEISSAQSRVLQFATTSVADWLLLTTEFGAGDDSWIAFQPAPINLAPAPMAAAALPEEVELEDLPLAAEHHGQELEV